MRGTIEHGVIGTVSGLMSVWLTFTNIEAWVRFSGELVTLLLACWSLAHIVANTFRKLHRWWTARRAVKP